VIIHDNNVEKITFRTHYGHYEFKVVPFGLTNILTTFQALMNHILEPFMRRFMLVLFDDILVYSSTLELHLNI
jgi:hypothetical protein